MEKAHPDQIQPTSVLKKGERKRPKRTKRVFDFKPTIQTRAWGDDLREEIARHVKREVKDDELLRGLCGV
ncbi:hypothetical protein KSD_58180 [Ktedonobacter sp. SOSP1-85]|nr:hypothetical protein KSD_58180 [Ktedonobacter sp. SOSP1-85]